MVFGALSIPCFGELLFQEDFDFPAGIEILGNENGWQADFNDPSPSVAALGPRHTQEASPFPPAGLALHPGNSKERSHKKLEPFTGQTIYFSFSMKSFRPEGQSLFRFRSEEGQVVAVGLIDGKFGALAGDNPTVSELVMEEKRSYFIAGKLITSADGRELTLDANLFSSVGEIPVDAPATWDVTITRTLGKPHTWNGVEFLVASSNSAFDGLRIGETWEDVTQR